MAEEKETAFTIGLLGANHEITKLIGQVFGAPGDQSDLQFYDRYDNSLGYVFTAVAPVGYPDKLKSLLQTCALVDIHIMVIDADVGITPEIGEILVAMDIFAKNFGTKCLAVIGNITSANSWRIEEIEAQLAKIAEPTSLKGIEIYPLKEKDDYDAFKKTIVDIGLAFPPPDISDAPYVKVIIDHSFPVKGVGTVVLGIVKQGQVNTGEMYDLIPVQKRVILRSIQKNDRDFKTAIPRDRVGLALKGPKPEDIDRNAIFCTPGALTTTSQIKIKLQLSPYYKPASGKISPGTSQNFHIVCDLGISMVKILGGDEIKPGEEGILELQLEKELPQDDHGLRGILADLSPFEKKLRILGYFESC